MGDGYMRMAAWMRIKAWQKKCGAAHLVGKPCRWKLGYAYYACVACEAKGCGPMMPHLMIVHHTVWRTAL